MAKKTRIKQKKIKAKKKLPKAAPVSRKAIAKKEEGFNICMRCDMNFQSRDALKKHLKSHQQAMQEIKLLEEGHVPSESKIGFEFKGKNRIIIS